MNRLAILALNEAGVKLEVLEVSSGRYKIIKENVDYIPVGEEITEEQLLKPKTITKIISILTVYREIIQAYNVSKIIGVGSNFLIRARNYKGIFEEVYNNIGVGFTLVSEEDYAKFIFMALNDSIDTSKANGIFIDSYSTYLIKYNRRSISSYFVIPYGYCNLGKVGDSLESLIEKVSASIKEKKNFDAESEEIFVGAGKTFVDFGRIAKKVSHYPLDIDNNYIISKSLLKDCFKFINDIDLEKFKKMKGLDETPDQFISGMAIMEAIFNEFKFADLVISDANVMKGIILSNVTIEGTEKFTDLLGTSFDNYYEFHKTEFSNNVKVCNMAAILFKQLKVMHKLPRMYVKPMRIAAYMYDCGKSVNIKNYEKYSLYTILNSGLNGASHRDLLLAGFICTCQNLDNFSLSEWMKYKDLVTDEDLEAVRKLGVIVKLASALNSSRRLVVSDVVCDILGDSIIMKTIVSGDATYDIIQGMKVVEDYRKVFKKNLQII